jgi:hypothetical protein
MNNRIPIKLLPHHAVEQYGILSAIFRLDLNSLYTISSLDVYAASLRAHGRGQAWKLMSSGRHTHHEPETDFV